MLFKNFWKHFKIYTVQLIALFFMILVVISLLGGQLVSLNWTNDQLKQLGKNELKSYLNGNYGIKNFLNNDHLIYKNNVVFSNTNYIDSNDQLDLNRFEKAMFRLEKDDQNRSGVYRFIVNDVNKTIRLVDDEALLKKYFTVDKDNNYVFYFKSDFIDGSFQYQNIFDIKNKTNENSLFISSHVIEQLIGKNLPLISIKKSVFDLSTIAMYQQMIKPYQDDLNIADIQQDDIFYLNNLLLNTLVTGLNTKEAQYSYYLNITDIITNLKRYIIPIDSKQKMFAPILTSGRLVQNAQEIIINPTYGWNNNLNLGDSINLFGKTYKIVGFATNNLININYEPLTSLTNSIYYWTDKQEYENIAQTHLDSQHFWLNCSFLTENNLNQPFITNSLLLNEKLRTIFSSFRFLNLNINGWNNGQHPHFFSQLAYNFVDAKKRDLSIIISIFSMIILIAAFVMISIIVNKIIHSNKKVIGNLKAQGYSSWKIAFALSNCFLLFTMICCLISLLTAWTFGLILNYTYINYFEFVYWIPVPDAIFIICCLIAPCIIVYIYSFGFITFLTSYRPLILMNDHNKKSKKVVNLSFLTRWFKNANFKHKVSLWFVLNSKWKVLLTLIITFLNATILFSIYSFFKQTSTVENTMSNIHWKYLYSYQDHNRMHYDLKSYNTKEDVKDKANEINLTNFLTVTDLKNKWMSVKSFKEITKIDKINNYQYIIDNLEKNDGIITFGYQPYIKSEEILGYEIDRRDYKIDQFEKTNKLFAVWKKQQTNKADDSQKFLDWIFNQNCSSIKRSSCRSKSFSNDWFEEKTIIDFNLDELLDNNFDLFELQLEHLNKNNFFKAKTIDEIDFNNNEVKNTLKHNVSKWKALFEKDKLKVNIYPLVVSKSWAKTCKLGNLYFKYIKDKRIVNLYYVVDYFTNLTKNLIFTNGLNNVNNEEKIVTKFSNFKRTELNDFIGIYDENNDYSTRNMLKTKDLKPIFKGQVNNDTFLKQSYYSVNLIKYILIIIAVFSVMGCFLQLTVVLNIIIRENIKYINTFKILGYSKLWIFNRLFLMYLPIIAIAYVLAIPLAVLVCFLSQNFMIHNTVIYTSMHISWINFCNKCCFTFYILYFFLYVNY